VRLFVALEIPSEVRGNLDALMKELRALETPDSPKAGKMRWVRRENLHVTLKFIGAAPPEKLDAILNTLSCVASPHIVEVRFRGLGFFPNEKRARVFWAGVEGTPNLATLAGDVDVQLAKAGFPRETRPYSPHLTLARLEPPGVAREFQAAVQKNAAREFGALRTAEFQLIESRLKSTGAEYTTLQSFRFAAEA
jgi:RNA 2',3'-cyclic 3'-phosphodiesterase